MDAKTCRTCKHFNGSQCTDTTLLINRGPEDKACKFYKEA